jgi:hypothetical protein
MEKKDIEKKLMSLAKKMRNIYLAYLDTLDEEDNEVGKEEGYLSVAIFRGSVHVNSSVEDSELRPENQINLYCDYEENPL